MAKLSKQQTKQLEALRKAVIKTQSEQAKREMAFLDAKVHADLHYDLYRGACIVLGVRDNCTRLRHYFTNHIEAAD